MSAFLLEDGSGDIELENGLGHLLLESSSVATSLYSPLEIYDYLDGSLDLLWSDLIPQGAQRYNVYQRLVTATPDYQQGVGGAGFGAFAFGISPFGGGGLATAFSGSPGPFTISVGPWELLDVTPVQGDDGGWSVTVSGLQIASYNAASGIITPSLTYDFVAVAVYGGVEVIATEEFRVTPGPTSVMLRTPMKRLWPFPNTGLD